MKEGYFSENVGVHRSVNETHFTKRLWWKVAVYQIDDLLNKVLNKVLKCYSKSKMLAVFKCCVICKRQASASVRHVRLVQQKSKLNGQLNAKTCTV